MNLTTMRKGKHVPAGRVELERTARSASRDQRNLGQVWILCICLILLPEALLAVTLDFWHPWPHANRTVRSLAEQYRRQTGVTVRVRTFQPSSYNPWTNRSSPDLVGLSNPTKSSIEGHVRAGRVYNLQPQMSRGWYTVFWPGLLETFNIRQGRSGGVYGVPLTGQVRVFVYNRNLFRKAGVSAPIRTWSELMTASQRLRRAGIVPYAGGFGSNRPPLAHAYEWSYLGLHNLSQTYFGRYPYTSREWIRDLSLYPEMRRYGFTDGSWASITETTAMKHLLDGRVAMVFVGPNFGTIRRAYKPSFRDWGVFGAPVDRRARFLPRLPGGVVEGLVINQRSRQKQAAIRFAVWLTQTRQQVLLANGARAIPATPDASASSGLATELRPFVSGMRDQSIDLRTYERADVLNTFYSGVRGLLRGSGSPSAVASNVQRVKRR